jgi:hypothetical protein
MAAMKNLDRRLARLEDRLAPTDFARNPRQRLRVIVCRMGRLDGTRGAWTDQEMEEFVESFPIKTV